MVQTGHSWLARCWALCGTGGGGGFIKTKRVEAGRDREGAWGENAGQRHGAARVWAPTLVTRPSTSAGVLGPSTVWSLM